MEHGKSFKEQVVFEQELGADNIQIWTESMREIQVL